MTTVIIPSSIVCLLLALMGLRFRRQRLYARLRAEQERLTSAVKSGAEPWFTPPATVPDFSRRLVRMSDLLSLSVLEKLRQVVAEIRQGERSYIPGHKKGGTIAYEHLHQVAPELVAFYQSQELRNLVSTIVGVSVVPTPLNINRRVHC
jgi:hypothetical protein